MTLLVLQGNDPATGVTDEYCIEVNKQPLVATTAGATANDFDPDGDEAPRGNSEMIRLSVLSLALTQLVTPVVERRRSDIVLWDNGHILPARKESRRRDVELAQNDLRYWVLEGVDGSAP